MNQDSYMDPIEGKTYISPSIKNKYGIEDSIRIVTRAIDSKETYENVSYTHLKMNTNHYV